MPEFTAHDKHVVELYKKAMVERQQTEERIQEEAIKELEANFWQYCGSRLKAVIMTAHQLGQMKEIAKAQVDDLERGISDMMNLVRMYTLPQVIIQLYDEAEFKRLRAKMKKKVLAE